MVEKLEYFENEPTYNLSKESEIAVNGLKRIRDFQKAHGIKP